MTGDTPTTTLTVPAKPAAITAANIATLAGTAAAVAGPVGWAVAGAAAAVPAVGYAAKKAAAKRNANRRQSATTSVQRTVSGPKVPRLGRAGSVAGSSAHRTGAGSGRHRASGLLRGLLGDRSRSPGVKRAGASSAASPGGRRANQAGAGRGRNVRSALGRAASAPLRGLARFGRGLASRPGKKATIGAAYRRNRKHGVAMALGAATRTGARLVWRSAGAWFRRFVLRRKPKKKTKTKRAAAKTVTPTVDRGISSPHSKPNNPASPQAAPGPPIIPGDNTAAAKEETMSTTDTPSGTREMAARMWANVEMWQPRGMLPVVEEYHDLPKTLEYMRATVGAVMDKSMKRFPVDQAIAQQIGKIVECLDTAAAMSRKIPEAVETIHKKDLDRLRNPRQGEQMWDLSANGRG